MKRSILIPICITLLVIVSCMSNEVVEVQQYNAVQTKSDSIAIHKDYSVDTPIQYLAEINHNEWVKIRHVEDRILACNPTQEEVEMMTTGALMKSILHYPLNYLVFVYDDPMVAINSISDNSLIHKEFERRDDAAEVIVEFFKNIESIEMDPNKNSSKEYKRLQYSDEMFLEYYMASKRIPELYTKETRDVLCEVVKQKIEERCSLTEIFSEQSLIPLRIMSAILEINDRIEDVFALTSIQATVYTPFGKSITAYTNSSYTQQESAYVSTRVVMDWEEAIQIAPATSAYNCHSYAWHRQSEYNNYWINYLDSNYTFQLAKYWTNDLYVSCTQQQAEIVFYDNSEYTFYTGYHKDHSAIILANGLCISKWGDGPLMMHEIDYCPYYLSSPYSTVYLYKKERTDVPLNTIQIYGEDHVSPGQGSLYLSNISHGSDIVYSWAITSYPTDPDCPEPSMNNGLYSEYAQVTFYGEGLYIIRAEASTSNTPDLHNVTIRYGEKYVYVY